MAIETVESRQDPRAEVEATTVLQVLTAGWTWRTDPADETPVEHGPAASVDPQLVRALAWARILIG